MKMNKKTGRGEESKCGRAEAEPNLGPVSSAAGTEEKTRRKENVQEKSQGRTGLPAWFRSACTAGALALFLIVVLLIYSHFHITVCPIYRVIGIPCPSCGMTRSWLALLHGHLHEAFRLHPLFWLAPVLVIAVFFYDQLSGKKRKRVEILLFAIVSVFIIVWLVRMILFFPRVEPMEWNEDAVLPRLFRLFK